MDTGLSNGSTGGPADPDPSSASALHDLARCLVQLYVQAGMPPFRLLEQDSAKLAGTLLAGNQLESVRLGRAAVNDMLGARKFPSKEFLLTFVQACGLNLEADRRWEAAWDRLAPMYRRQFTGHEKDLRQQQELLAAHSRADGAEADNLQFRLPTPVLAARSRPADLISPKPIVQPLRRWDPERIGPYAILGKLGAGAMGQVFLARSATGRLVAVKTIRVEMAEEPGFRSRFAREVAAARRVSGVFTAPVIEADADADLPWVATAYVPAPSLSALVRECGPLPVPAVRWLVAGCAEALASIHGAGLLHRDIKPSNVLVAPDGPRVIDFGVARATERIELTAARESAGTPAYMAPEQARDARAASPASDIFSLGATLVYAATGHPPYQGETAMDILVRLATEPPDLSGLPEELSSLATVCLERVPRDRPTDAAILERLGSFALLAGPGHPYLPDSAMALIAEYQRGPLPAADGDEDDDQSMRDTTSRTRGSVDGDI